MAIKLLFITGVPWVFEIAAWLSVFLSEGSVLGSNYVYIFEISNLLNSLRGVIIFIIFIVLQPNVRSYLLTQIFNKEIPVKNSSNQPASSTQTSELWRTDPWIVRMLQISLRQEISQLSIFSVLSNNREWKNTFEQIQTDWITH